MNRKAIKRRILVAVISLSLISALSVVAHRTNNHSYVAEKVSLSGQDPQLNDFEWLWKYKDTIYDLSPEAILGDRQAFEAWKSIEKPKVMGFFDRVNIPEPNFKSIKDENWNGDEFALKSINFTFPNTVFKDKKEMKTLLALPLKTEVNSCKPIIIAISGHEVSPWGEAPYAIFKAGGWGYEFAKAGYIVYAPPNVFYDELSHFWPEHDYYVVWTEIQKQLFIAASKHFPKKHRYAVAGLSSGSSVGALLMTRLDEIELGVLSGILFPLDYLRENYRIKDHPNSFDIRFLYSYLPLYALIAPRPLQFQMGRNDGLFPSTSPGPQKEGFFPGTPRGVSSGEMAGEYLVMNEIWQKYGKDVDLVIHDGGHEFFFPSAEKFIYSHFCT